jgi:acyl-CoA synthetase (AMP-forming)/AMP-acid ligase II
MLDIKEKQNQKSISKGSALSDAEMRFSLLPEALEQAALSGEKYGISYLQHDGSEYYQSYAELLHIARGIHTGLVTSGLKPQDKVIFQLKKNEDFIAALWGCFMSGVIPVPLATPPSYRDEHITLNKLRHTCELLDGAVILTDESDHSDVEIFIQGVGDKKTQVLSIESLMIETLLPGWHRSDPHDVALLLLTSGSTGKPKAVMQCHHSLLARTQAEIDVFGFSNKDISFNWMPLDHVGGIIMCHLRDVFAGITQIHAYTDYILQDPLKWIDTLDKYRVTATWAPNFAYGLINDFTEELKEKKWDLSCVRFALNGGEAIVSKTARDFLTSLAPFGFSQHAMFPAWGMSETCSGVTCNRNFNLTSSSDDDSFVSVGDPLPGVQIRIVNDNNEVLPEGESGYLQIQGAPVTSGYFNNADANKESFTADGWFITGDLGLIEDHSLTIIGRSKDVVIVNGINFYSHEVEAVAEQCAGVTKSFTAAFSVRKEGTDTDKVAVLFNPKPDEASKVKELINEIRTLILSKLGLNADYIIPVSKEQIPKTAIGKIQRTQLKNTFEAGTFDSLIAQWTTDNDTSRGPDWIFRKVWQPRKLLPIASAAQKKFLIFSPSEEIDDCLRKKLHPIQDVELLFIRPGSHFKDTKNGLVFIRPTVEDDFKKLVEILSQVFGNPDQILFLWSLQATEPPNISEFRSNIFPWEARTLLRIVQMLSPIFEEEEHEAGLYLATYRTQRVDSQDDVICYQNSVLLGLAHTLSKENPWFHCVCVDFDKIESASLIDLFFEEVSHNASEREISYRHDKRFIPRIEPVRHVEQDNIISLKEGGVYIVSGGLGGVGMSLTEELLSHYQANVLIIGRSDKKEKSCEIQTLENLPGNVAYEECDLGDSEKLNKIVYGFVGQHDNKLHGIFHLVPQGSRSIGTGGDSE